MSALFALDIDNTLIYSHRHPHPGWPCVEWIDGREQAYMSPRTIELCRELFRDARVALVTSRSVEQYRRLRLTCQPELAITANGADLLVRGVIDPVWRRETDALLEPWRGEIDRCYETLKDSERYMRCRIVDDAYLFVYCAEGIDPGAEALQIAEDTTLQVMASGKKLYLLPPRLNKGEAVKHLMARLGCGRCVAAGDSAMDLPMLRAADIAIAPKALQDALPAGARLCPPERVFSEYVLETALALSKDTSTLPGG